MSASPHLSVGAECSWQQFSVMTLIYSSCWIKHIFCSDLLLMCLFVSTVCFLCVYSVSSNTAAHPGAVYLYYTVCEYQYVIVCVL